MSSPDPEKDSRTELAEDRTVLANERTFAGWMRTGMAAVALALGLRALFGPFEPAWVPKLAATALIGVALFIFWAAWRSTRRTLDRLDDHVANGQTKRRIASIAGALSLAAVTTGVVLWFLRVALFTPPPPGPRVPAAAFPERR